MGRNKKKRKYRDNLPASVPPTGPAALPRQSGVAFTRIEAAQYSGPLPPPAMLRDFEEAYPGSAARILDAFEEEGAHRRQLETRELEHDAELARRGQTWAGIIAVVAIGAGTVLIALGRSAAGITAMLTPLVPILIAFAQSHMREHRKVPAKVATPQTKSRGGSNA